MPLAPGTQLSHYEILSPLGAGGMGEVYLARDLKLDRQVAIKVLPGSMTSDHERIARFEREAKLLAALNHGHIAAIHGFDDADAMHFLVMEYVEGDTLAQRLKSGRLEIDEALDIARQIAEALEAAHDKGIIHRDLKPGNIMIRPDGSVKVLDFGLAKAMAEESPSSTDAPTITAGHTQPGVVLGTAAYMSPEQARGRALDVRSDIWSFGVILFECLTGKLLFRGPTAQDSIGAILHKEPEWVELPPGTPPTVQLLLRRCLAKDRRRRLQAIGDARVELDDALSGQEWITTEIMQPQPGRRPFAPLPWILCAVLAVLTAFAVLRPTADRTAVRPGAASKSVITLQPGAYINWRGTKDTWSKLGYSQLLAVSRDGRRLVLTVQEDKITNLYLKDDRDFVPKVVPGTDGARGPFLSPDGLWVGFLKEKHLLKVRLPGGTPQPICEFNSTAFDATWLDDDTIVYSTDLGLRRVAVNGGPVETLTSIDMDNGIRGHHSPHAIAGTLAIMFTVTHSTGQDAAVLSLEDGTWHTLKKHASDARYVSSGHVVFARNGELFAAPFDPSDLTTVGTEVPVVQGIQQTPGLGGAIVHLFDTSDTGTLIYAPMADPPDPDTLLWLDSEGNEEEIVSGAGHWMHQRLSPDGQRILFNNMSPDGMLDLYIYDIKRDQTNRLTHSGNVYDAEWSPDGKTVGFAAMDTRGRSIYLAPSDFSGSARKLIDAADARPHFSQWSEDGTTLLFFDRSKRGGVWTISPHDGDTMRELMNSSLGEAWAMVSPDNKLIAYVGFVEGRRDVYVKAYPSLGPWIRVSQDGGGEPRWGPDSRTLYYREAGKIFKVRIVIEPKLDFTDVVTMPISDVYDCAASGHQHYDLSHDGTRFLMVKHGLRTYPTTVHVIEQWPAALDQGQ